MNPEPAIHSVDARLPAWQLVLFGLQHVLSMAASPVTAVFLVSRMLSLPSDITVHLIGATFFVCGAGTLLQSLGAGSIGARLPFVMVPGGAPAMLFAVIATQTDLRTAAGAAILTSLFYWIVLPVFARCLRFFPRVVVGTMLVLVSVSLIKIYAGIVVGQPGTPGFARPQSLGLALLTIVATLVVARLFKGTVGRLAVLLGLAAGTFAAWAMGLMPANGLWSGPLLTLPTLLPFGMPRFDVLAALPMLIFSVISMAEATGQTVAVGEITGRKIDMRRDVPRTIRGDALASLIGALLGTSLIITSAENIGVVQTTGVRSRYVTATAGAMLMLIALFVPLGRFAYAIPAPVVGGTALIVFAMIGVMGINLLGKVDLHVRGNQYTLAAALVMGLIPVLVPNVYAAFPASLQIVLGNGMAAGTLTAIVVNLVFGAWRLAPAEKVQTI
ncbi:uracil-xanthine permease family protein [Paraburkholderia sp. BL17N1]|uniref:uracil-xanthine permease family protein n=1 Tax=Paraburkholderia sp. BL17N1 TaxID=1938798 RepID=UPI000F132CB2|nr:uracil-xanthine permease family protein [Paraburkholderia sp. BL17N1]RKR36420.1 uracil-xanthine permease [Paraburkholderia sp. BL17N1]